MSVRWLQERWTQRGAILILLLVIFLYLFWLTTTQNGVDEVATAGLEDIGYQFEEWLSYSC